MKVLKRYRYIIAIVLIAIALYGLLWLFERPFTPSKDAPAVWPVHTIAANPSRQSPIATIYATVRAPKKTTLSAQIAASVRRLFVHTGEPVRAHQLLIQLDDRRTRLHYQQQLATLQQLKSELAHERNAYQHQQVDYKHERQLVELAKKSLQRYRILSQQHLVSIANVEQKQDELATQQLQANQLRRQLNNYQHRHNGLLAQIKKQQALLENAQLNLNHTQIRAPYGGKIISVEVGNGQPVQTGQALINLYNPQEIESHGQIPHRYLHALRQALKQAQDIPAVSPHTNPVAQLRLTRLSSQVKQGHVSVEGLFLFTPPIPHFAIGTVMTLHIHLPPIPRAFSIPTRAIYEKNHIFVVHNQRLRRIPITVHGQSQIAEHKIITSPQLRSGDSILAMQLSHAANGVRVKVIPSS